MDFEYNKKLKFSSKSLQEVIIKSESPNYDSNEETSFTEAQCEMINLINENKHEVSKNEEHAIKLEGIYRCYECQQEFQTPECLNNHIDIHYVSNLVEPHLKDANTSLKPHDLQIRTPNDSQQKCSQANKKRFVCDVCFRSYSSKSYMKNHKKTHFDERDYKCDTCKKIFKSEYSLKNHFRVHTTKKPYECHICKKKIKYQRALKLHVQSHMEDGRPHKCSMCSMAFTKPYYLEVHMLIHAGIKNFRCDICEQAFIRKDVLKSHLLLHQDRSFACDVCNRTFVKMSYLKEHKKIHSDKKPHVCKTCGKSFIYAFYLKTHMRTHTGEKPYNCDICKRKFSRSYTLRKHKLRAHTKGRKYYKRSSEHKTKKSSDCRRDLLQSCNNDSDNTSKYGKEKIISNSERGESAIASGNSILFSVENERCDSLHLTSEIEFADVKIECEDLENEINEMYS